MFPFGGLKTSDTRLETSIFFTTLSSLYLVFPFIRLRHLTSDHANSTNNFFPLVREKKSEISAVAMSSRHYTNILSSKITFYLHHSILYETIKNLVYRLDERKHENRLWVTLIICLVLFKYRMHYIQQKETFTKSSWDWA